MQMDDDQRLIKAILAGSRSSFEELMQMYNKKIFNFILRMVRNQETAVELTQDFFLKIYTNLEKYNFQYKFSTWAYRICYNLVLDHIRKQRGLTCSLDDDSVSPQELVQAEHFTKDSGFSLMAAEEIRLLLWEAVDQLPLKFRELILMRFMQELKYEEIAEITGLPVGTVKNRIFKAKEFLRAEMENHEMLI